MGACMSKPWKSFWLQCVCDFYVTSPPTANVSVRGAAEEWRTTADNPPRRSNPIRIAHYVDVYVTESAMHMMAYIWEQVHIRLSRYFGWWRVGSCWNDGDQLFAFVKLGYGVEILECL